MDSSAYQDTGCDCSPSCLNCSLPQSKYDLPVGSRVELKRLAKRLEWERTALELLGRGQTRQEIAAATGVTRRTVFRRLARRVAAAQGQLPHR